METIKIAIVEPHGLMRYMFVKVIDSRRDQFSVTFECRTGGELINYLTRCPENEKPDIVMTAYQMTPMDGYEVTTRIKERFPAIKVVVFSIQHDDVVVIRLIKAGVSGYLNKNVDDDELLAALKTIADNGTYFKGTDCKTITDLPDHEIAVKTFYSLPNLDREFVRLCTTEISGPEIKKKLGGVYQAANDQHICLIYDKFGVSSRLALVLLVAKHRLVDLSS